MPGLDREIAQHYIPTYPDIKPVKQKLHRLRLEWIEKIREEIAKQIQAYFLDIVEYLQWLANIVPIPKKDDKM